MAGIDYFGFANAALALLTLPLFLLLLLDLWRERRDAAVPFAGLEYASGVIGHGGRRAGLQRFLLRSLPVLLLALLWAGPRVQTDVPLLDSDLQTLRKNLLFAIDVSRSMAGPLEVPDREARLAAYGSANGEAAAQKTRFEAAREAVYSFIDRFPDARVGLVLFSTEPFLARWPTTGATHRFREILSEDLGEASQLRRFSALTNTDAALRLAQRVFAAQTAVQGGAVILISDAEDELENMSLAIRALRGDGIRLYTIGVGISESVVDDLSREFRGDPGFRIFRADSAAEMQDAYRLVSALEESPRYTKQEQAFITDLRQLLAYLLVLTACVAVGLLETRLHRTRLAAEA